MGIRWTRTLATSCTVMALLITAGPVATVDAQRNKDDHQADVTDGTVVAVGSMYSVVDQIEARDLWNRGITGAGVNVAIIDTGISMIPELTANGKLVASVDLSTEAGIPGFEHVDQHGHGTHVAGIIAGRDPDAELSKADEHPEWFLGIAPDAGIVSVKVADRAGGTDLLQVIAAVDWVIEHKDELDIGVLNLAYSSGSPLDYRIDPLTHALERAWDAGIVVVTAAGNGGKKAKQLASPAIDPLIISVGGIEVEDDGDVDVAEWSSRGDKDRHPDVGAPGTSIQSLLAPASDLLITHPDGFISEELFAGSGTSQSAAVVSGAVALLLSDRPELTPDQVKDLLRGEADELRGGADKYVGMGAIKLGGIDEKSPTDNVQNLDRALGTWDLLDVDDPATPEDESVWIGARWSGARWSNGEWEGAHWSGGEWMGARWSGAEWTGARWSGARWSGARWSTDSWTTIDWS